jgi:hypothetical protein
MVDGDETEFDFLSNTKLLLGISNDTDDKILQFLISTVTQEILNFCNISKLPSALNFTLCEMVADVYRDNQKSNSNNSVVGNISTISEDGRSVSFTNGVELRTSIEDRIARTTELKRFKKLYRVD